MSMAAGRTLIVSAHTSDFCTRCGGTIVLLTRNGGLVKVMLLSYGERGESDALWMNQPGISEEEVKRTRHEEALGAAAVLGAEVTFLDYRDNPLVVDRERLQILTREIRTYKPDRVLTHWRYDPFNPDHEIVSRAVLEACHYATSPGVDPDVPLLSAYPRVFFFEPDVLNTPLTGFVPDVYVDVTAVWGTKLEAIGQLRTQPFLGGYYTRYGEYHGAHTRSLGNLPDCRYAEAFRRLQPWAGNNLP